MHNKNASTWINPYFFSFIVIKLRFCHDFGIFKVLIYRGLVDV